MLCVDEKSDVIVNVTRLFSATTSLSNLQLSLAYIFFYITLNHKTYRKPNLEVLDQPGESVKQSERVAASKNGPRVAPERDAERPLSSAGLNLSAQWLSLAGFQLRSCVATRVWGEPWPKFGGLALILRQLLATWALCFEGRRKFPLTAQKQSAQSFKVGTVFYPEQGSSSTNITLDHLKPPVFTPLETFPHSPPHSEDMFVNCAEVNLLSQREVNNFEPLLESEVFPPTLFIPQLFHFIPHRKVSQAFNQERLSAVAWFCSKQPTE